RNGRFVRAISALQETRMQRRTGVSWDRLFRPHPLGCHHDTVGCAGAAECARLRQTSPVNSFRFMLLAAVFWILFGLVAGIQVWISMLDHGHNVPWLLA